MNETMACLPAVSVVIPCYNAERWVGRAIDSVLAQEGVSVEVIVVDDGSSDGSLEVLSTYAGRIHYETGSNRGACVARNRGLRLARAASVMFLDADDYLEPNTLNSLYASLHNEKADIAFCRVAVADAAGTYLLRPLPRLEPTAAFIADWITGRFLPPCGILWRRSFLSSIGGWNEQLGLNQDGELVLRATLKGARKAISGAGRSVYWSHESPDRISNTFSAAKLRDSFGVLVSVRDFLLPEHRADPELEGAFSQATHGLQRLAHRQGLEDVAETIRRYRQAEGWPAVVGSRAHCLASQLLGLGRKERLSHWLAELKARQFRRMSLGTRSLISLSRIRGGLAARRIIKG